jgi:hypothetical protein
LRKEKSKLSLEREQDILSAVRNELAKLLELLEEVARRPDGPNKENLLRGISQECQRLLAASKTLRSKIDT